MSGAEHPFPWSEDAICRPSAEKGAAFHSDDFGGIRGTVGAAVDFARECSEDWGGVRVACQVEKRRADLPPNYHGPDNDGPTWLIRPRPIPSEREATS